MPAFLSRCFLMWVRCDYPSHAPSVLVSQYDGLCPHTVNQCVSPYCLNQLFCHGRVLTNTVPDFTLMHSPILGILCGPKYVAFALIYCIEAPPLLSFLPLAPNFAEPGAASSTHTGNNASLRIFLEALFFILPVPRCTSRQETTNAPQMLRTNRGSKHISVSSG